MTKANNKTNLLFSIIAIAALALPAQASTLTVGTGVGENITITVNGAVTTDWAGQLKINVNGTQLNAMCADLFTNININQAYSTTLTTPDMISGGTRVAWLMQNVYPTITTADAFAGLQLAIWDIVHDGGDGFSAGKVQSAGSTKAIVLSDAVQYESLSAGKVSTAAVFYKNIDPQTCVKAQTLVGPQAAATPEPGSMIMLGIGCLAGVALKLRRKN